MSALFIFLRANWKALALALLSAPAIYLLGQCSGIKTGRAQMQHAVDVANTKVLQQQQRADTLAANQRLTDTIAVNHQEQELRNAIASTSDTTPDAVRIALGCERLRRANGSHQAALPAVCRPGRGVQAGAVR